MAVEESDLLMKLEIKANDYVAGEATTTLDLSRGGLVSGFKVGNMFEVNSFTLAAGLKDDDEAAGGDDDDKHQKHKSDKDKDKKKKKKTSRAGFLDWRRGQKARYPVDMQPISFKRLMDAASTTLLQNTVRRTVYKSASIIKRKPAGGLSAGEVYLRFDFVSVMIIKMEIDNDEPISESFQFICRGLLMSYKPQLPDGTLGAVIPCWYPMAPDVQEPRI